MGPWPDIKNIYTFATYGRLEKNATFVNPYVKYKARFTGLNWCEKCYGYCSVMFTVQAVGYIPCTSQLIQCSSITIILCLVWDTYISPTTNPRTEFGLINNWYGSQAQHIFSFAIVLSLSCEFKAHETSGMIFTT